MTRSKTAAKSVFIIIIFAMGSKVLGFVREALIAAKFGSGAETDTFFIALAATSLFAAMITSSLNTTMIPVLSEAEAREGKKGKQHHTNNLLNIVLVVSLGVIAIAWILAPLVMKVLAYGFEGGQYRFAVLMMRIGLFSILFAGIVGVLRGYLQSEMRFTESAAANFPFNFVYILFLIFFASTFGIKGLMVASVLAVGAQILIQIPAVRKIGFRYRYVLDVKDRYVQRVSSLVPPVLVSVAIGDLNTIVNRSLASTLVDGSISALNYASKLNGLVTGIFITAITTVIFPILSKEANRDSLKGLKRVIVYGLNVILLIAIPATVGLVILASPITKVAFERGAFDATATFMTSGALVFYSLGVAGSSLRSMLYKVCYSLQDTKTPMINGFISVSLNIILCLVLIKFMEHRGLALATSISSTVTAGLVLYLLRKKIGAFGFSKSVRCGLKSAVASAVMGVVVYFLYNALNGALGAGFTQEVFALFATAGVGVLVYSALIYVMRVEEVDWIIGVVRARFGKEGRS